MLGIEGYTFQNYDNIERNFKSHLKNFPFSFLFYLILHFFSDISILIAGLQGVSQEGKNYTFCNN